MVYIFQSRANVDSSLRNSHKETRMLSRMIVPTLTVVMLLTLVLWLAIQRV